MIQNILLFLQKDGWSCLGNHVKIIFVWRNLFHITIIYFYPDKFFEEAYFNGCWKSIEDMEDNQH